MSAQLHLEINDGDEDIFVKYLTFLSPLSYVARHQLERGQEWPVGEATFDGEPGEPKMCYANSARRVVYDDAPAWRYVEGYVTCFGFPIEHAFLIDENGVVVEPTIRPARGEAEPMRYYGVVVAPRDVLAVVAKYGRWGPVLPALLK